MQSEDRRLLNISMRMLAALVKREHGCIRFKKDELEKLGGEVEAVDDGPYVMLRFKRKKILL